MERGEDRSESRFICKFCDKRYPCGKSLGGHIRTHVIANSGELDEPNSKKLSCLNDVAGLVEFGGASSGYGLRENPKKTWRAVDSSRFPSSHEKICKQCGKGFQSLKALCGHMACHSDKDRGFKDDHSWISENIGNSNNSNNHKLVMDSHSDTEGEDPRRLTRSKSKIYKKVVLKALSPITHSNNYNYNNNGCSSASEIDDQEQQEEVAKCLMMLSRDSGNWGGVNSVVESSDNNSVVLETKSSSIDMRIARKDRFIKGEMDKFGGMKLKSSVFDTDSVRFEKISSGYLENGSKKVESDISVDELLRSGVYGNLEYRRDSVKEKGYDEAAIASKYDSKKITREVESSKKTIKAASFDFEPSKNLHKRSKYECLNCNKSFSSHQALGGHRPCHKKINAYSTSNYESGENSLNGDNLQSSLTYKNPKPKAKDLSCNVEKRFKAKKNKGHECPICFRIFKSGQALGGHKRSHFIGGSEDRDNYTRVTKHDLLDLNLPAPVEDEADEYSRYI